MFRGIVAEIVIIRMTGQWKLLRAIYTQTITNAANLNVISK